MEIVKASAGSGKTYTLAHKYMDMLFASSEQYPYRHILAVTFTNKATAEMKSRILKELNERAQTDPKAKDMLVDLLHDYGAFSVSTIDRFFQHTLKAFAREIGQFSDYQVELDKKSLVNEAMDRILDGLTEDKKDLVAWLRDSVMDKVEQGKRFNMDDSLYEIGESLKSDEHRHLCEERGADDSGEYTMERLAEIHKVCRNVVKDFEKGATAFGLKAEPGEKLKAPSPTARKKDPALDEYFEEGYGLYGTAYALDKLVFSLGVAGEFYREFDLLLKEKNVMPLDDSNTILKDIIAGSDAPFVYEKLGVRYEHFLLDEFQDTSGVQWANFLPLLRESHSNHNDNLIVGDVKQSIYRWRSSDWELLGKEVQRQFPDATVTTLDSNWRSLAGIVNFNNKFFKYAAGELGLADIYSDVEQKVMVKDDQKEKGQVRVSFCEDQKAAVLQSARDVHEKGARWGDIVVLVRGNKEGGEMASMFIDAGIPVISDDSLSVRSSVTVRRLVSLLSSFDDPKNAIPSFLASFLKIEMPATYHSLPDLCEDLLRKLHDHDSGSFDGETMFIQAFMDDLQAWVDVNGNNLPGYLKHWDEKDIFISSPEDADAVRVMTVHKSKGLEFPYVIFPYAEKVDVFKHGVHWCHVDAGGTALGDVVSGNYPVDLSSTSEGTLFQDAYERERRMQLVDNMNIFYVALTRAVAGMHIIAKLPSDKCKKNVKDKKPHQWVNFSELLYAYCGGSVEWSAGEECDYSSLKRKDSDEAGIDFPSGYPSIAVGGRLGASQDALDFFGEDGTVGSSASARLHGIELHAILSAVRTGGELPSGIDQDTRAMLAARIAAHPQWFNGVEARNEVTVFGSDGSHNRPDRVVSDAEGTLIIDYKFGAEHLGYERQVRRYMDLYRRMGYPNVRGVVWYVPEDRVVELS